MLLHFILKYRTRFGQQIYIVSDSMPNADGRTAMQFSDEDHWEAQVIMPEDADGIVSYYYLVEDEDGLLTFDGEEDRFIDLSKRKKTKNVLIVDTWVNAGDPNNVLFTKVFQNNLLQPVSGKRGRQLKSHTHEFRVKAPMLNQDEVICLLGSTDPLHNWDTENPILLAPENNWFVGRLKMEENEWPAAYKYGVYNTGQKKFVALEQGDNRLLRSRDLENRSTIFHDGFMHMPAKYWRGAGVNVPVFSLRTKKSFGVGEFNDLRPLIDWCSKSGIEMIQLLPINDTSAQDNWRDSYPYAAISAFALHPLYINLEKVAGKQQADLIKKLKRKQRQLNALAQVDYEQVIKFKRRTLRELYDLQKADLKEDVRYFEFFDLNRHWLVPYAAFCYLKEKYKTADYDRWKKYSVYDESAIQKLVAPTSRHYDKIAIYYYEQYHLHRQLHDAVVYAHRKNVVLKGDLPIGIYRYSCDAWTDPSLYHFDQQAGAPPDDFSSVGQNWGFPTYNWERMKVNHFAWWRKRFDQLEKYFSALRIDHILGFFRIWSIPADAIDGTMGRFVPAIPVHISEFGQNRIYFNYERYCQPYITDEIVTSLFGEDATRATKLFLTKNEEGNYSLNEYVNTQKKAAQYTKEKGLAEFADRLLKLISNVILFEEPGSGGQFFHFRIDIHKTSSFQHLDGYTQSQLQWLYHNYFFERQEHFWRKGAMRKLPFLKRSTKMLVCGEDLGMVPDTVPAVMHELGILGLNVERMPKTHTAEFFHPADAAYLSIVQPSTHDMSTLRGWWQENREKTQRFYNQMLGHAGEAPRDCTPEIAREIIVQHLYSPAMWSIFLIQDLFALDQSLSAGDPADERINDPSDPQHYWRYRMNIELEDLLKKEDFVAQIRSLLKESGRLQQITVE